MKIILDTMGFENSIKEPIIAARNFVKKFNDVEIILVGNEKEIKKYFKFENEFKIVNTEIFIKQDDDLLLALRTKKDSSMSLAIDLVNKNEGDAVVSAGSTPCFVGMSYSKMGLINNVNKIAFTPSFPSSNGKGFNMLDVGANIDVNANDLVNFAIMGNIYVQNIKNIKKPTIALLNVGTEDHKGLASIREAHQTLKKMKSLNYIGFAESRDLLKGEVDLVVSDGFTGNICLKALEGSFKILVGEIKKGYKKPWNWIGAIFSLGVFAKIKKTFDYKNNAGAVVLGLKKIAIKTHGSADAKQFYSSLELARKSIKKNIIECLEKGMEFEKEN